jgi:hypothetical protein
MKLVTRHCAVALGLVLLLPTGRAQAENAGYGIAGIEAKLFYSNSGRFSANILGNPKIVLHNTPIGEGTIGGPSENTLIIVKIQGPPRGELDGLELSIVATTKADTLADRDIDVGAMNSTGNYYAACWLDDTGCDPVTVEVRLIHGKESQRAVAMIPFVCSD